MKQQIIDLLAVDKNRAFAFAWEAFISGDFEQRWEIARLLPKCGDCAIAPLINLLEDETADLDLRCEAAEILAQFQSTEALFALTTILNTDTEPEVITACTKALAKTGKIAIPSLIDAIADPQKRLPAVQALAYLHQPEIIEPLLAVVNDDHEEVRRTAITTLSHFRDPRLVKVFMQALQDVKAKVRKEAVIALGRRSREGDAEAIVEAMTPLLYDINIEVCSHCAIALGKIGTHTALIALNNCLNAGTTPIPLKQSIISAMTHNETRERLSLLEISLKQQPVEIIPDIITSLGRWQSDSLKEEVARTLIHFFQDHCSVQDHNRIKQALAVALGNLTLPLGKSLLEKLARDDAPIVQLHAQAALKKFL